MCVGVEKDTIVTLDDERSVDSLQVCRGCDLGLCRGRVCRYVCKGWICS